MARRKKEPRHVHREKIAFAASKLFAEGGISATSMDDIAKAAGYSKATLYVYFENKEEIMSVLVLDSMKRLCSCISSSLQHRKTTREKFDLICKALIRYQEEFPFYFKIILEKINVNFENQDHFTEEKESYRVGEEINEMIRGVLLSGMESGDLRRDIDLLPTSFSCWGMLSGLILLAANKKEYIQKTMGLSQNEFLQHGFDMIYQSLAN